MKKPFLLRLALCSLGFAFRLAQQPKKIPRIGYLAPGSLSSESTRIEVFRQALRELGYLEGKDIVTEYRFAEGKVDRLPDLAVELVGMKLDVIVVRAGPAVQAAKDATRTIPIIMAGQCGPDLLIALPVQAEISQV